MRKIKIDKQLIIFLTASLFLIFEAVVLLPAGIKRIVTLNKKNNEISQKIKSIEIDWPNKKIYVSKRNDLSKKIEEIHNKSILYKQSSTLISFISSKSKDCGVKIKTILPGHLQEYPSAKLEEFKLLPIRIKSKSNFHDFANFLDQLQSSKYFFEIKSLEISPEDKDNFIEMEICGLVEEK